MYEYELVGDMDNRDQVLADICDDCNAGCGWDIDVGAAAWSTKVAQQAQPLFSLSECLSVECCSLS